MFGLNLKVAKGALAMGLLAAGGAQAQDGVAGVTAVSDAFYSALNEMMEGTPVSEKIALLWLNAEGVTAQHPIGGRDMGLDDAVGAFDGFASIATGGSVKLEDQAIAVFGDTAVETGVEIGTATLAGEEIPLNHRVTNVYILTESGWRMVHHHTDLSPPAIDLLERISQ